MLKKISLCSSILFAFLTFTIQTGIGQEDYSYIIGTWEASLDQPGPNLKLVVKEISLPQNTAKIHC